MRIERLEARHFRNLAPLVLELDACTSVLRGPNAQGKTNILEALYVCATGRSFRNASPRDLISHNEQRALLTARFERQGVHHDVEVTFDEKRRSMNVDGRSLSRTSKLLQLVNVVAFFPDDLRIAKGSPEERRRFLDRAVGNYRVDFVDAATAYAKVLKQRNALLRAERSPDQTMLGVYDEQLLRHGSVMHTARETALAELVPAAAKYFDDVMHGKAAMRVTLASGVEGGMSAFAEQLKKQYSKDRARGSTSSGPHRADLLLEVNGREARSFASQGQQRALVLALKLAEVETLGRMLGTTPLLLLDDVSSELDRERSRLLFETIGALGCQTLVSTTGATELPLAADTEIFDIEDGRVTS
ncbi:MAG: DNA replication/repair protein RecF [Clostridia bacterium]|nr:DNA replication/repair protein RecF [Deltaproteobacteria bacterium]